MTRWASPQTEVVYTFLEREDVKPAVTEGVEVWDDGGLLGIQLANWLESLVRKHLENDGIDTTPLDQVDWYQLAQHYALEIVGADEDELIRRNREAGGSA